ncbi:hypothetical protein Xph01_57160 [Micromonospora phaseoli]|nr:hypothetical protein Xph01_57160 [Micromonospora phaseoli]
MPPVRAELREELIEPLLELRLKVTIGPGLHEPIMPLMAAIMKEPQGTASRSRFSAKQHHLRFASTEVSPSLTPHQRQIRVQSPSPPLSLAGAGEAELWLLR